MNIPRNMMLDVVDPIPLLLKRFIPPKPPEVTDADRVYEQWIAELRAKQENAKKLSRVVRERDMRDFVWPEEVPPAPGDYLAWCDPDNRRLFMRHWNGKNWSGSFPIGDSGERARYRVFVGIKLRWAFC